MTSLLPAKVIFRAARSALLLFTFVLLLAGGPATVRAQAVLDASFDPHADLFVWALVVESDGRILVGGDFSFFFPNGGPPVHRDFLARLNQDGTVDPTFNPSPNGSVREIQLQPDGKILVAGGFTTIGTQGRFRIARIDPVTGLADSFNPSANGSVYSIAVQADGKVLAGGSFTAIGGQARKCIARLDAVTGLADSFDPTASSQVYKVLVQPDGKILIGGQFGTVAGQTRIGLARLDPITGLPDSFDSGMSGGLINMVLQPDGKLVIGGHFTSIGGVPRHYLARLDPTTGLADSFNPDADGRVYATALQPDGRILVGGYFHSIGGQTRNQIAQLEASGDVVDSFDPAADTQVIVITVQPDGKILAGGYFTDMGGQPRSYIARFLAPPAAPTPTPTPVTPTPPPATPTPTATPSPTTAPSPTAAPSPTPTATPTPAPAAQALQLSTRMKVQTGDNVGIGGFIITGSVPKQVMVRAVGASFQLGWLGDAVLELRGPPGFATIINDNCGDFVPPISPPFCEPDSIDSAIVTLLDPGAYTAIVRGKNNFTGIALVEVYDLTPAADSKLANMSTRALVGTGSNVVVAGLILGGNPPQTGPDRIVVRGIGPSLTGLGVLNALADPKLELRNQNGALLLANNNWQDDPVQAAELTAAGLAPGNPLESALVVTLSPGPYTALLFGTNNGTGIGLVEVYDPGAP